MVSGERLLLIAAEPREFGGLVPLCRDVRPAGLAVYWARCGSLGDRDVVLVANGAGAARAGSAAEAVRRAGRVDVMCSTGFCGALDGALAIGDIFVADGVCAGAQSFPARRPDTARPYASGAVASIDHVAQSAGEKSRLRATGARIVEMEAAGVARKASEWGVPFYCVRSVTDLADESFGVDFNRALRPDGRFDTWRILAGAMRRPGTRIPELLRLRGRSRSAAANLGEFLASCRF